MGALDDPAVTSEPLAAFDAFSGDARHDPTRPALLVSGPAIVGLVGVQLVWTTALAVAQGWDGVERRGASIGLPCRLAPLRQRPSGVPRASVTRWLTSGRCARRTNHYILTATVGLQAAIPAVPAEGPLMAHFKRATAL